MYTELKSYQIIIALLKKYGIRHCVLSAGSRNVPFVHSVEEDPYFKCYSVVDERSAGYFALGLAQETGEPVVISCTASTASCNYWPPVAEAFYQDVPLVILTSDRDPHMLGQREDQMIDQVGMFDRHVKKSVNLPIVDTKDDFIWCQRLVNEALLELDHHGKGTVHINIPMNSYNVSFTVKELPEVTKFERLQYAYEQEKWDDRVEKLKRCKKILLVCGQNSNVSEKLKTEIKEFSKKFNCAVSIEYMSNINDPDYINTVLCTDTQYITNKKFEEIMPEIVVSFGGNIVAGLKEMLRRFPGKCEHWLIQEDGRVVDLFKNLTTIFECTPEWFFEYFNTKAGDIQNDNEYNLMLKEYKESIKYPEFEYSNVYAIKEVVENVGSNSMIHMAINNAIRITNYCCLKPDVKVYANIGTFGIDGCMSSFLGQACARKDLCYLIIGDLAYFYDMNAMRIKHINKNVRILLINNEGGGEFYYNYTWINKSSDLHTTARHCTKAEGWVKENGFKYLCAHDKLSFDKARKEFMDENSDQPILLEVFTEMSNDAKVLHDFYALSKPVDVKQKGKEVIKGVIGQEAAKKLKSMFSK